MKLHWISRLILGAALLLTLATPAATLAQPIAETAASAVVVRSVITSAEYDEASDVATIGGKVECSAPTLLTIYVSVRQFLDDSYDRLAEYFGSVDVLCDTSTTRYKVPVTPGYESEQLQIGRASINAWASYCIESGCSGLGTDREMRVKRAR